MEAEWFQVDRQTDRTKLTVTLYSCVYAPNDSELVPRAGPKHVGAPVRLILCHSFKPTFFNLGLVSLLSVYVCAQTADDFGKNTFVSGKLEFTSTIFPVIPAPLSCCSCA